MLLDANGAELGRLAPQTGMVRFFPDSSGNGPSAGLGLSSLVFRDLPRPQMRQAAQLMIEVNWGTGEVERLPLAGGALKTVP
ncbi:hypothetical protein [Deinococcus sp. Marseille-Q6407]|uniref:hypothetical protein n=1 Tax=Deinococcus sp. Marseille-Q6407 TaxID=2969223 RepID=UPI0021BFE2AA|nr:hypothetical protein [Deinococcus sp. Marseille-Q6407]